MGKEELKFAFRGLLVLLSMLLAGVTIAAALSGSIAPEDSVWMPILGLATPVLLVINVIVGILWLLSKHRKWFIITLVAFGGSWPYLTATVQFNSEKSKSPDKKYLKVATYNIAHFGGQFTDYTPRKIADTLAYEGVDIICFQEFGSRHIPMADIKKALSDWPYVLMPADTVKGVLSIAVFSRYPLVNDRLITYDESANCSMVCDVVMDTDTVRLFNNHLQTTSVTQKRKKWAEGLENDDLEHEVNTIREAAEVLHGNFLKRAQQTYVISYYARTSPYPVVLCGDFNSIPSSYTYHVLSQYLEDGFRTAGNGYMYTYRYGKKLMRIDYLFHSPDLRGIDYYSLDLDLCSDHNPAILEVELPS